MSDQPTGPEPCDLGWSIGMTARGYAAAVEPVFEGFPRGARGYQLLHTVIHKEIRTQMALADYLGVDRTVMPYVIDDLQAAGYVQRRDDPSDRRVRTVIATPEGLECYRELAQRVADAEAAFFDGLADGDREGFVRTLSTIAQRSRSLVGRDGRGDTARR